MAYSGHIDRTVYTLILQPSDYSTLRTGRQIRVQGSHIYLHYLIPNPHNKQKVFKTQSRIEYRTLKTKKKVDILINKDDLNSVESGQPINIRSFKLIKESVQ